MQFIHISDIILYLENSRIRSSIASSSQCLYDHQMQQFVAEFYHPLQKVKCQQEIKNQFNFGILTFILIFTSMLGSTKYLTSVKYPPDAAYILAYIPSNIQYLILHRKNIIELLHYISLNISLYSMLD